MHAEHGAVRECTLVGGGAAYRSSLMGGFSFNSLHARRGHKLNETIAIIASLVFSPRPSSPYPNPASESMMILYPSAIVPPRLAVFATSTEGRSIQSDGGVELKGVRWS